MSLFRRRVRADLPPPIDHPPRAPDGWRIYVFGDLHGRADLLDRLAVSIGRDREASPAAENHIVGLGDLIDRGPASKEVIDRLLRGFTGCKLTCVRGNHEQMLLDFLEDPLDKGPLWFRNGARETLLSYGAEVSGRERPSPADFQAMRDGFAARLPPAHVIFLQSFPLSFSAGDYFFVHAGARPGTPLDAQTAEDLLWIRGGFADRDPPFEKVVVHGHTPTDEPTFGTFRINLDTGAYLTNRLTCLVLEGANRRTLTV